MRADVACVSHFGRKHDLTTLIHGYEVVRDTGLIRRAGSDSLVRCPVVGCDVSCWRTL